MRTILAIVLLLCAACGNDRGICQSSKTPNEPVCAPGVVPDDKAGNCTDSTGSQFICRNGLGYCVLCNGGSFSDGCKLESPQTMYCVHDCSGC
jgi:hypothetical protein